MRLGIIGPGLIWQKKHKITLGRFTKTFSITAFCASSERLKVQTLHDFPNTTFDTDLQIFLSRDNIDAVLVLTPIHLNAQTTVAALKAGKHVFLEKPMAHSLQSGHEVVEAAQKYGKKVWVLEQAVYHPCWGELRNIFQEKLIGDLVYFDQVVHWPIDAGENDRGGYGKTDWRIKADYPLGHFFDGGPHQLAVLSSLFGAPDWIFATGVQLRPEFGEYDHIVVEFGYSTQLRGVLSHSSVLGEKHNGFTVWGTNGSVTIDDERYVVDSYQGESRRVEIPQIDAHDEMWQALEASVTQNQSPIYTLNQAWSDLAVLLAIDESIKTGKKINLKRTNL